MDHSLHLAFSMKAIRIHSYGHSDKTQIEEAPRPTPKKEEVLVRIRAAGVNPIDWKIREGEMKVWSPASFPLTLGQDFAGEVIELGADVKNFDPGDEVYGVTDGAYAELSVASVNEITLKPRSLDSVAAAALPTPALTAYQIVTEVVQVVKDQTILIIGAAGGVGSFATQLCKWKGARVIAVASAASSDYLKSLGVDQIIDYKTERFEEKVLNVDAVIDLVGGDSLTRSFLVVKPSGLVVTSVGPLDESKARERGVRAVEFVMQARASDLAEIAKLVDQGILKPRLSKVMSLVQAKEAQDLNQSGQSHGKVVLKVA